MTDPNDYGWHSSDYMALSFLFFVKGVYNWPYFVWVWWDGHVSIDFGCILK